MMTLEKQLAKTDLNVFKKAPLEHFAREICRYRLWKTERALDLINYAPMKRTTAIFYFNNGIAHIEGRKNSLSKNFKAYIDEYMKTQAPIQPKENDRRPASKVRLMTPIAEKINVPVKRKIEMIEKFIYAMKISTNMLVTFNTERELDAFTQGYKLAGGQPTKTLQISAKLLEDIDE